jgi:hypothetical protein
MNRGRQLIDALRELRRLDAAAHATIYGSDARAISERRVEGQREKVRRLVDHAGSEDDR